MQRIDPVGEYDERRERRWFLVFARRGEYAALRHCAVLSPGEDLTENPPTVELDWGEWLGSHGDYGLGVDGELLPSSPAGGDW